MESFELDFSSVVRQFWAAPDEALFPQTALVAVTGLSAAYFERARWGGVGPRFIKLGRLVRYKKSSVLEWLDSGKPPASTSEVVGIPGLSEKPLRGARAARPSP